MGIWKVSCVRVPLRFSETVDLVAIEPEKPQFRLEISHFHTIAKVHKSLTAETQLWARQSDQIYDASSADMGQFIGFESAAKYVPSKKDTPVYTRAQILEMVRAASKRKREQSPTLGLGSLVGADTPNTPAGGARRRQISPSSLVDLESLENALMDISTACASELEVSPSGAASSAAGMAPPCENLAMVPFATAISAEACAANAEAEENAEDEISEAKARVMPASHWMAALTETAALSKRSFTKQRTFAETCCNRSTTPVIEAVSISIGLFFCFCFQFLFLT